MYQNIFMNAGQGTIAAPLAIMVTSKAKLCIIAISGRIAEWTNANSTRLGADIKAAIAAGADSCQIYVNSVGGNVFEANEIINLIEDNFESDNITVKVGALCASAGTIFPAKYHATGKPNSQFMIHKPKMGVGGNEDEIEANLKLLKNLTSQYKTMYATKFGITEDAVEALWAKGDYWMDAKAALKMGLLNAIEKEDEKIDAAMHLQLVACGAPQTYKPEGTTHKHENPKPIKMELSVLAVTLGLPADATQAVVDAKLAEVQALAATAASLKQAAEDKSAAEITGKIKALLDQAEIDKKITASVRGNYEAIGQNSFENLEAILKTVAPVRALSNQLEGGGPDVDASGNDYSKFTFADYQEKAPEAYLALMESDPKKAEALKNAHYKD